VLAVCDAYLPDTGYPSSQDKFEFRFKGLVAFYDPPKKNIKSVLESFYNAGIVVKIVTGDTLTTTQTIAEQINFRGAEKTQTGQTLALLSDTEFDKAVDEAQIFARVSPDIKLKIVKALKKQQYIVAMTGDGVNDAPALKAANIGIAMGRRGSEMAKEAAALILTDDDLGHLVSAVAMGRKIYSNLKKAIQYIISIHIPIVLIVLLPLLIGWVYPTIFTPIHIIFFELIMGPTCSIIYENEPIEKDAMIQKPRELTSTFFNGRELSSSIVQGLVITAGLMASYWLGVHTGGPESIVTTMVFLTLIASNVLLTLVNRSFYYSILSTLSYRNRLVPAIVVTTVVLVIVIFAIPGLRVFFGLQLIDLKQVIICIIIAAVSVLWFEVYKWLRRPTQHPEKEKELRWTLEER
jgi:P-type Ca2+ transporter type 2C